MSSINKATLIGNVGKDPETANERLARRVAPTVDETVRSVPHISDKDERDILLAEWIGFLDANPDDLTSPEDCPAHALVSFDNFKKLFADCRDALSEVHAAPAVDETELDRLREALYAVHYYIDASDSELAETGITRDAALGRARDLYDATASYAIFAERDSHELGSMGR